MNSDNFVNQLIIDILSAHKGHDNRIRRETLLYEVNAKFEVLQLLPIQDRFMRECIEYLRRHSEAGAWICSSLDGGYFLAETLDELQAYLAQEERRAKKLLQKVYRQRKVAGLPLSGQINLMGE